MINTFDRFDVHGTSDVFLVLKPRIGAFHLAICSKVMALDLCQIFVFALYLEHSSNKN